MIEWYMPYEQFQLQVIKSSSNINVIYNVIFVIIRTQELSVPGLIWQLSDVMEDPAFCPQNLSSFGLLPYGQKIVPQLQAQHFYMVVFKKERKGR